jgi:ribosomal-protein-alanine N-acetyltransferase
MTYDRDLLGTMPAAQPDRPARMPATIEPVTFRELRKVSKLQRRAFRPPLAYGIATLFVLWALPHVRFLVARDGDRIVSCAIGDRHDQQSRVINICVDPESRRQGIATRMLRTLETELPIGDVVLMVEEGNPGAQSLYRQEGYVQVGLSHNYYGRGLNGIWMQKHRTQNPPPKIRV